MRELLLWRPLHISGSPLALRMLGSGHGILCLLEVNILGLEIQGLRIVTESVVVLEVMIIQSFEHRPMLI